MKKIGLTGGIASGKSSVATTFRSLGVSVVDADVLAREVVAPGQPGLQEIHSHFGDQILLKDGSLNRKELGALIFSSTSKRKALESILHPKISELAKKKFMDIEKQGAPYAIYEAPLLFENGLQNECSKTVLVYLPPAIQLHRLMSRDGLNETDAKNRIQSQMSLENKLKISDHVVDNSGSPSETEKQVAALKDLLDEFYNTAQ